MKLFFRTDGTLGTVSSRDNVTSEDPSLTSYIVADDFKYITKEEMTDSGPVTTYITHDEFLQQQSGN